MGGFRVGDGLGLTLFLLFTGSAFSQNHLSYNKVDVNSKQKNQTLSIILLTNKFIYVCINAKELVSLLIFRFTRSLILLRIYMSMV